MKNKYEVASWGGGGGEGGGGLECLQVNVGTIKSCENFVTTNS